MGGQEKGAGAQGIFKEILTGGDILKRVGVNLREALRRGGGGGIF